MKHHEFSPSKLEQYYLCPGSKSLSEGLPDDVSEEAKIGTRLHEAVQQTRLDGLDAEQEKWVTMCLELLKKLGGSWEQEVQLYMVDDNFDVTCSGTVDALRYNNKELTIIDWKFGRNPVTKASENLQLRAYAYMALQRFEAKKFTVILFQPPLGVYDSHTYTAEELSSFPIGFNTIKDRCQNGMELHPSEKACRYCKAMSICPAYSKFVGAEINALAKVEHIHDLPAEKVGEWLSKWKLIKKAGDAIEHRAKELLLQNVKIPGWTLKTRVGNRVAVDPQGIYNVVQNVVSLDKFMQCVDVSLSKLDDIYTTEKKAKDGTPKTKGKKELAELIAPFVERKPDQLMLVKEENND